MKHEDTQEVILDDKLFFKKILELTKELNTNKNILLERKDEFQEEMNQIIAQINQEFDKKNLSEIVKKIRKMRFCRRAIQQLDIKLKILH